MAFRPVSLDDRDAVREQMGELGCPELGTPAFERVLAEVLVSELLKVASAQKGVPTPRIPLRWGLAQKETEMFQPSLLWEKAAIVPLRTAPTVAPGSGLATGATLFDPVLELPMREPLGASRSGGAAGSSLENGPGMGAGERTNSGCSVSRSSVRSASRMPHSASPVAPGMRSKRPHALREPRPRQSYFDSTIRACAAASRAIGTRKGEQLT